MTDRSDKLLPDNKGVVLALHIHMATLAGIVRCALGEDDLAKIQAVSEFLDDALKHPRAVSEIETAVAISFVDVREFRAHANGERALSRLPTRVRQILLEQDRRESEGP
jgi:hypothetical protein